MQLIVIPCSKQKQDRRAPLRELYTGPHFRAALAWALTVAPADRVLVLSALYGLRQLDDELSPYDYTIQDRKRNKPTFPPPPLPVGMRRRGFMVSVCGREYDEWLRPDFNPVAGLGIGQRLAWFKANRGRIPGVVLTKADLERRWRELDADLFAQEYAGEWRERKEGAA